MVHVGFDDPPALARDAHIANPLAPYRRVRDEIRRFVAGLPGNLEPLGDPEQKGPPVA